MYRRKLASFRPPRIKGDDRRLTPQQIAPYNVDLFASYFTYAYHALYQVCVVDARDLIPNWMLVICMDIQSRDINRTFDFAFVVAEGLHNSLCDFMTKKSSIFR